MIGTVLRRFALTLVCIAVLTVVWWLHPLHTSAATVLVTGVDDEVSVGGTVSLREAIQSINQGSNLDADVVAIGEYGTDDRITFAIPGNGMKTISVHSALPVLTKRVQIDGYTQPGASANSLPAGDNAILLIALETDGGVLNGLEIGSGAGGSTLRGLAIGGFAATGILDDGSTGVTIAGNTIGANALGSAAHGNAVGIGLLGGATGTTIGGPGSAARNIISGNGWGIIIQGPCTTGNVVQGNLIGTNASGMAAIPNISAGIIIFAGATNTTIGGTAAGGRNVISGNGAGVVIQSVGTMGNVVQGNFLGTDADGAASLSNGIGILLFGGATSNTIGGTDTAARNVISGNTDGVVIQNSGTSGNVVQGNFIGTNFTDTAMIPNTRSGIAIFSSAQSNTIGGTAAGGRNVISGNGIGIRIESPGTTGNVVQGNLIGTNSAAPGIVIGDGATRNTIGGPDLAASNLITGNGIGIQVTNPSTVLNVVQGNLTGTNAVSGPPPVTPLNIAGGSGG